MVVMQYLVATTAKPTHAAGAVVLARESLPTLGQMTDVIVIVMVMEMREH